MSNKVCFEVDNCCDCIHSHIESIRCTIDTAVYCTKVVENNQYRFIVADEDVRKWSQIPDWCPIKK